MILKNNNKPIITNDGNTPLFGRITLNNKTNISNEFINNLFLNTPNSNNLIINISYSNEPFNLTVKNGIICITGNSDKEILLGLVNLSSLREQDIIIPNQIINDIPKTQHREFMLDIARNFVPKDEIKRIIDEMFRNRINYLHLHFSDDENYAIESKIHPELNTKEYLTQEELKEIINYAKTRGIEVIPEFDMPGHLNHLLEINSDLRCNKEKGNSLCFSKNHDYLYELIDEICNLFPCKYYHLGGDELGIKNQCKCPGCQELMKQKHFTNPKELAADFINKVATYIQNKGKKVIVWNDALKYGKINENIIIQKWFNYPFDKTCLDEYNKGRKVIITSASDTYFDYPYSFTPLRKTYDYIPEINNELVLKPFGVSSHLWTEVLSEREEIEKNIFPRVEAFGENAWLDSDKLDYKDFLIRLEQELINLQKRNISFTELENIDKFISKEALNYLNKKMKFKNYTDFSTVALLKLMSEYYFNRKSNKQIGNKYIIIKKK